MADGDGNAKAHLGGDSPTLCAPEGEKLSHYGVRDLVPVPAALPLVLHAPHASCTMCRALRSACCVPCVACMVCGVVCVLVLVLGAWRLACAYCVLRIAVFFS
jgi:hypothetical protein